VEPTKETYLAFQSGYDYFNKELFGGALPNCLITLQRQRRTYGYFCAERFAGIAGSTDEIALNPSYFATRSVADSLSTLVHEQVHQWQERFGKPGRGRYHNKEWADKMEAIGLVPSDSGKPGGKKTGDRMTHYILAGGAFDLAVSKLIGSGYAIPWADRAEDAGSDAGTEAGKYRNRSNRLKFTCPTCGANAWGKPDLKLVCGDCRVDFVAPEIEDDGDEKSELN
jgi:hypothetical protein